MPSYSYRQWRTVRSRALDEIAEAHAAIGGSARGRRFATQQINRAYAVLLAAQFQGYCRDLHSECVEHLLTVASPPIALHQIIFADMTRSRQLDRGNAQPGSLGADFNRFSMDFWHELHNHKSASVRWKQDLDLLNEWRNAVVHEDFTSAKLRGIMIQRLSTVRQWRRSCARLARAMDEVMGRQMYKLTGINPW
jgi:hypothetical protein